MSSPSTAPDPWSGLFQRRCKARLRRRTSKAWGHERWGRCELRPHRDEVDHCLDYGMWVLLFGGDPFRVRIEPTELLVHLVTEKLRERGDV